MKTGGISETLINLWHTEPQSTFSLPRSFVRRKTAPRIELDSNLASWFVRYDYYTVFKLRMSETNCCVEYLTLRDRKCRQFHFQGSKCRQLHLQKLLQSSTGPYFVINQYPAYDFRERTKLNTCIRQQVSGVQRKCKRFTKPLRRQTSDRF